MTEIYGQTCQKVSLTAVNDKKSVIDWMYTICGYCTATKVENSYFVILINVRLGLLRREVHVRILRNR